MPRAKRPVCTNCDGGPVYDRDLCEDCYRVFEDDMAAYQDYVESSDEDLRKNYDQTVNILKREGFL